MQVPRFVNQDGQDKVRIGYVIGPFNSAGLNLSEEEERFLQDLPENQSQIILGILNKCAEKGFWLGKNLK